ncbi:MAG: adenylate/guanylate cyclase domain-containing protein [Syntrophobacterales bacterium]|nr:adenylate/guanylate cyclase domain-containing protein [Syntrophobacterales bacterium]
MKKILNKLLSVSPLKIAVLVIAVAIVLFFIDSSFLRFMELKAFDLRTVSRGAVPAGQETVIVTIDEKSLSELGRWPWPRTTIAELTKKLKEQGAKAVGFDIVFAEPDNNSSLKTVQEILRDVKNTGADGKFTNILEKKKNEADTDALLAESIAKAQNVTLGYFFHLSAKEVGHLQEAQIKASEEAIANGRFSMVKRTKEADERPIVHAYAVQPNLPVISEAAENGGYFNAFPDRDGIIRWSPLVIKFRDNYYSSLALSLLVQYLEWPMLALNIADFGVESIRLDKLRIPTDEEGRLLINYLGPPKTFPHYSVSDILKGRIPPYKIKGKIVLVGATATGIYDMRTTPFSSFYPGVEIHATVIDNILRQNFLIHSGWIKFIDVCIIVMVGLLIGFLLPRLKAMAGMALSGSLIAAFIIINTNIFIHYNVWMNMIYPLLTMIASYLGITVYRYVTEEREKKKIRGAFQYYLTASVVNEILKDPSKLKLGGDKKNLSVMFSDIRGFTSISEQLAPEQLVQLLNEYLTAMTNIVFKHEGLLDKYIGDAIMAVFGAPLDQPDHARRACLTAVEMMSELKRLRIKWASEGWPPINIGIGINTGDMVVGNMGSEMRFDYTVMGDSVNLSSRLEGTNKEYGTNIIVSEFTHEIVKDEFFFRELDAVRVKGKKLPVRIFELLGEQKDKAQWQGFADIFATGLQSYREGRWDEAIAQFNKVLGAKPGDYPAQLYLERCEALKENPPEGEWDGVFTMTKK